MPYFLAFWLFYISTSLTRTTIVYWRSIQSPPQLEPCKHLYGGPIYLWVMTYFFNRESHIHNQLLKRCLAKSGWSSLLVPDQFNIQIFIKSSNKEWRFGRQICKYTFLWSFFMNIDPAIYQIANIWTYVTFCWVDTPVLELGFFLSFLVKYIWCYAPEWIRHVATITHLKSFHLTSMQWEIEKQQQLNWNIKIKSKTVFKYQWKKKKFKNLRCLKY